MLFRSKTVYFHSYGEWWHLQPQPGNDYGDSLKLILISIDLTYLFTYLHVRRWMIRQTGSLTARGEYVARRLMRRLCDLRPVDVCSESIRPTTPPPSPGASQIQSATQLPLPVPPSRPPTFSVTWPTKAPGRAPANRSAANVDGWQPKR